MRSDRTGRGFAEDDAEIRNLLARLVHVVDGKGSIDDLLALWTEDCTWSSPLAGTWEGHQGHRDRHAKFQAQGVQGKDVPSVHLLTTTAVRIEGDDAWATSTFLFVREIDGRPQVQDAGYYDDVLRRTDEGWKMARREVTHAFGGWLTESDA